MQRRRRFSKEGDLCRKGARLATEGVLLAREGEGACCKGGAAWLCNTRKGFAKERGDTWKLFRVVCDWQRLEVVDVEFVFELSGGD